MKVIVFIAARTITLTATTRNSRKYAINHFIFC